MLDYMKKSKPDYEFIALALFVILIPLMFNTPEKPLLPGPFSWKIQLADIGFLLLLLIWGVKVIKKRIKFVMDFVMLLTLIFYLLSGLLSFKNSNSITKSVIEFLAYAYGAGIFVIIVNVLRDQQRLRKIVRIWLIMSMVVSVVGILGFILAQCFGIKTFLVREYKEFPYVGHLYRVYSTFLVNAKFLSTYLTIAIPLSIGALTLVKKRERQWLLLFLATFFVVLALTFSRGWLGLCIAIYLVLSQMKQGVWLRFTRGLLLVFIICFGIWLTLISRWQFSNYIVEPFSYYDVNAGFDGRAYPDANGLVKGYHIHFVYMDTAYYLLKKTAIEMWRAHPFLGIGLGMFNQEVIKLTEAGRLSPYFRAFDPHCTFLGQAAETGTLGLLALIAVWAYVFVYIAIIRKKIQDGATRMMLWICMSIIVGYLIQGIDMDIMNFRFVWVFMAAAFSYALCIRKSTGGKIAE